MNPVRFDALARGLAARPTRRQLLRGLAAGLSGARLGGAGAAAQDCKADGQACKKDSQCCSGLCPGGPGTGGTAHSGAVCCTPERAATTCAGKCGPTPNNCGQGVDCTALCTGCCRGDACVAGTTTAACGGGGASCVACPAGTVCHPVSCLDGQCAPGTILNCCTQDSDCHSLDPCQRPTCDTQTNTCGTTPVANGQPGACPTGEVCCGGSCTDTQTDAANCGGCGVACQANTPCSGGAAGCCLTGQCGGGICLGTTPTCGSCATPTCDPQSGAICVSHCAPPDACHTGGTCLASGGCFYQPKCGACETCDPSSGACAPTVCGPCEACDPGSGQCSSTCVTPPDPCSTAPGTCVSGPGIPPHCVYQSACGVCQTCMGSGTCGDRPAGTGCGTCQACDGAGQCRPLPAGTASPDCADGYVCDGQGGCACANPCGGICCPGAEPYCCQGTTTATCCAHACTSCLPNFGCVC